MLQPKQCFYTCFARKPGAPILKGNDRQSKLRNKTTNHPPKRATLPESHMSVSPRATASQKKLVNTLPSKLLGYFVPSGKCSGIVGRHVQGQPAGAKAWLCGLVKYWTPPTPDTLGKLTLPLNICGSSLSICGRISCCTNSSELNSHHHPRQLPRNPSGLGYSSLQSMRVSGSLRNLSMRGHRIVSRLCNHWDSWKNLTRQSWLNN